MNKSYIRKVKRIKKNINILDVIGNDISLKKSGDNYQGFSPYVKEKTPSFFVSPRKQIFKCFASGNGGDVIEYIKSLSWKCEDKNCGHVHNPTTEDAIDMLINSTFYKK